MAKNITTAIGDCYDAALLFMQDLDPEDVDEYTLCHGNVSYLRQDEEVDHAWVDTDGGVYEVANGQCKLILKDVYYKKLSITKVRRYTLLEGLFLALKHGHSGP